MKKRVTYGYVRVSTKQQHLERQIKNILLENPEAVIIKEQYTGIRMERPAWTRLMKIVKPGDTIIFDEVSRMSRDAEEGFRQYNILYQNGVNLVFLKEPHINTAVYRTAMETRIDGVGDEITDTLIEAVNTVLQIVQRKQIETAFAAAQKEVDFLHERISEGIKQAQASGKTIGRKKGVKIETRKAREQKKVIMKHAKDFGGSLSDKECIKQTGLCRNTYYKYKKELKESLG